MSRTRMLMAELRRRLGHDAPMAPPGKAERIPRPPRRVFPIDSSGTSIGERTDPNTTALVGIGHVGTRYATDVVLQFQAELAVAHEAVASELPDGWAEAHELLPLVSRVEDHRQFLLRPDLGRRLSGASLVRLRERAEKGVDVQLILADGLSAFAAVGSGLELLAAMRSECERNGLRVGTPVCAKFARVWLEDEIGEEVDAKVSVIMLGERPGLGTGDGLSAYLVFQPRIGKTDGDRNMMSNIHRRGTTPEEAAPRLVGLIMAMIAQKTSGVDLDLSSVPGVEVGYREPQVRRRLVFAGEQS